MEKLSLPAPVAKEIPGKEGDFVSSAPEPKLERATKVTVRLAKDAAKQKQMESSRDDKEKPVSEKDEAILPGDQELPVLPEQGEAPAVMKGQSRKGHDLSVPLETEEKKTQENAEVGTSSEVLTTALAAGEKTDELIIREEPGEVQETSATLELGEGTQKEQPAEPSAGRAGAPGEAPQEKPRQPGPGDRGLLLPVIVEGELLETSTESARPAQVGDCFLLFQHFYVLLVYV